MTDLGSWLARKYLMASKSKLGSRANVNGVAML
jgi:hypothetical protein